ncbi:MAG: RND transporter [Gammaproteobacteria bacterium RIFCSPHIGHO2_12_FULL_41_15]|nr:MAG: RND transporter [Gammaproteobacteria bacterium RIFCSPHIGHO2_12_FULL_41_15]
MWLVKIALTKPYTFIVLALLILIFGVLAIMRTPTDIFPSIRIPVISVVWTYAGAPPDDMANRITSIFERAVTTTVNDIEHIESASLMGESVTKLFFHPNVNIAVALAQVAAISQTILKNLPPGATPPLILSFDASTVPILQLVLSSQTLPEEKLNDLANNFIRTQLATVQGAALPSPYGGKVRQINVYLNQTAMQTFGVSAQNVAQAVNDQTLVIPAGTQKVGPYEYIIKLNNSPTPMQALNEMPVKSIKGGLIYMQDVAQVLDGFAPQTNIVKVNGERAVMMSIEKTGGASALSIIERIKSLIPLIKESLPDGLDLSFFSDQSIFIIAAIHSVIDEGILAALLTGLMILLFLGSIPSTFIILTSIPLSMLASISMLAFLGETINIMTLGGLALAVGILVDDATVTIENINYNIAKGKDISAAILEGAKQIAIPAFVSTTCICIVFIPMFFLGGIAQYLFVPFAEAVIFAMLASYFLSRTLVPTLCMMLIKPKAAPQKLSFLARIHQAFEKQFLALRHSYKSTLTNIILHTKPLRFILSFSAVIFGALLFWPFLGANFFPSVDAGQMKIHIRAPTGTRVEETAKLVDEIDRVISKNVPKGEIATIVDNIGLPVSGINLSYSNSATVGPEDADILISLTKHHTSTAKIKRALRKVLEETFPHISIAFLPADIVNQILNFGQPSAINIKVMGIHMDKNRVVAARIMKKLRNIPGVVEVREREAFNYPALNVDVDRSLAKELKLTELDIAKSLLITLSGSFQTTPNFWIDPDTGVSYPITTQAPQYSMDSIENLRNVPLTNPARSAKMQILGAVAKITPSAYPVVVSHYNVQPLIDIYAGVEDRDLGSITQEVKQILLDIEKHHTKGVQVYLSGQAKTQQETFRGLYIGLIFSILLIYLLIVVNFQSWLDPFIIITALPAAIAGIGLMLFITETTLSVPALTGAIMCMGVATANSILVISFARTQMESGMAPAEAAITAGITRLRPVLMTALAMILGMIPMAIGAGQGGEQNAALGRAVIGGLCFATVATLFFVPAVFSAMHGFKRSN